MLPKGIIFDLDDTLVQFDAIAEPAWLDTCELHSAQRTLYDPILLYETVKETRKWYWSDKTRHKTGRANLDEARRTIVAMALDKIGLHNTDLVSTIAGSYADVREKRIEVFPSTQQTLDSLSNQRVLMALITNGEAMRQRAKIERFGLQKYFRTILIEGEVGHGKPEKEVYLRALSDLALKPNEVWSVGDNLEWDVAAPQRIGIYGIWHDYLGEGLPKNSETIPDRIVHSISEIVDSDTDRNLGKGRV